MSSLLIIRGKNVPDEDYAEYGRLAGLKFIRLKHKKGFSTVKQKVRGFQGAEVIITGGERGAPINYTYKLSKDSVSGKDAPCMRPLIFTPDRKTNLLTADCIDTPFNRKKLACQSLNNPFCEVQDVDLSAQIGVLANEIKAVLAKEERDRPSKDAIIAKQHDDLEDLRRELAKAKNELSEKKKIQEVVDESLRVNKKEKQKGTEKTSDDIPVKTQKKLKKEAKEEIYAENPEAMEEIKKLSSWQFSSRYKREILPLIDKRYQEKLHADNSGDSN